MANRFVGDFPRHDQNSTVKSVSVTNVGFTISGAGALTGSPQVPPQFFIEAVDPQTFTIRCPKGNPAKCWAFFTADDGNVAIVTDYSTIADGTLTLNLVNAPAGTTRIRGYVAYGRDAAELPGGTVAPTYVKPVASHNQFCVSGLLPQLMFYPVGWTTDGAGEVTLTRAPLGTSVAKTGTGEYTVTLGKSFPLLRQNWADMFGNSESRGVTINIVSGSPIITFDDTFDMADGERSVLTFLGPVSKQSRFYGAEESGGVYSDLKARDIHNYSQYPHGAPLRAATFIPFRVEFDAGSVIDEGSVNTAIPANMRVVATGSGTWDIHIGSFPENSLTGMMVLSDGANVGVDLIDAEQGVISISRDGGAPTDGDLMTGYLIVKTEDVD